MTLEELRTRAQGRIKDLTNDDENERIEPLCIDDLRTVRIEVSWGGPQEYFDILMRRDSPDENEWSPLKAEFHYLDWATHETYRLSDDETDALVEYFDLTESLS